MSDKSTLYTLGTPFEAPMRAGLGELHWRFKCLARCRKCGKEVGQTWACPRLRWGKSELRAIRTRHPTDEQIMTTIMLLVHTNHVGRKESHGRGCPVAALPKAKYLLAGTSTRP